MSAVASAKPDGYTLLVTAGNLTTMKATLKDPRIDAERSFEPISQLTASPYLVAVNSKLPVQTMRDFFDYARSNPRKLNYGYVAGSASFFTLELLRQKAKLDIIGVPFGGSVPMVTALAENEIQFALDAPITLNPFIDSGHVRAIAVTTERRAAGLPDLPTISESGIPGFEANYWFGLLAPAGTPPEIVQLLGNEAAAFMADPDINKRLSELGYAPLGSSPSEFREKVRSEVKKWDDISTSIGWVKN
jgi:tripartite-type tricarboxylate transporter receptor subunit TctC